MKAKFLNAHDFLMAYAGIALDFGWMFIFEIMEIAQLNSFDNNKKWDERNKMIQT